MLLRATCPLVDGNHGKFDIHDRQVETGLTIWNGTDHAGSAPDLFHHPLQRVVNRYDVCGVSPGRRRSCRRSLGLDRLAKDLAQVDASLANIGLGDERVRRLMTIAGINLTVAVGLVAAIGDPA